jgi:hypothetical protein
MTDLLTLFDIDNPPLKPKRRPPIKSTPQLVTRFMSKVYVQYGMPDGCWIWTGTLQVYGYGEILKPKIIVPTVFHMSCLSMLFLATCLYATHATTDFA